MPKRNPCICRIEGCGRIEKARQLCRVHWRRDRNGWAAHCRVIDCQTAPHSQRLCRRHYDAHRDGYDIGIGEGMFGVFGRTTCEECDQEPMGGGRWCLDHFHAYVDEEDRKHSGRGHRREPVRCGTHRGRERHRRKDEPMCPACVSVVDDWLTRMTRVA